MVKVIIKIKESTNNDNYKYICYVCNSTNGIQKHHFAPKNLFGKDCNKWPTAYLCIDCHFKWHRLITPDFGFVNHYNTGN